MPDDDADIFCLQCGYNLRELAKLVCPECGRGFDPGNPTTYRPAIGVDPTGKRVAVGLVVAAMVLDGLALLAGMSDGGRGWAFSFPVPFFGGLGAALLSLAAVILSLVHLLKVKAKSMLAWLVILAALLLGGGGFQIAGWAIEAINAV